MKPIAMLLVCAGLLAAAGKETFTGTVTDTMCGGDHKAMNMGSDEKCVTECAKMGAKYALWDGHAAYELSDQAKAGRFAAKKVTVTGTMDAKTRIIKVDSITAAK
jgi:hypothetical protein